MNQELSLQGLENYEELYVEVFYPEQISSDLRNSLDQFLGQKYLEKYTYRLSASEVDPIMSVEHQDEVHTLFGDEINEENILEVLSC